MTVLSRDWPSVWDMAARPCGGLCRDAYGNPEVTIHAALPYCYVCVQCGRVDGFVEDASAEDRQVRLERFVAHGAAVTRTGWLSSESPDEGEVVVVTPGPGPDFAGATVAVVPAGYTRGRHLVAQGPRSMALAAALVARALEAYIATPEGRAAWDEIGAAAVTDVAEKIAAR